MDDKLIQQILGIVIPEEILEDFEIERIEDREEERVFHMEIKQSPFNNFCSLVEANRDYIVNYFDGFHTNAIAESTNAQIQLAAIKNRGSRDLDFFLYRVANFYSLSHLISTNPNN